MSESLCKLYDSCAENQCASDELCSLGECVTQSITYKGDYFISAVIYMVFGLISTTQAWRMRRNTNFGCVERCFVCCRSKDTDDDTNMFVDRKRFCGTCCCFGGNIGEKNKQDEERNEERGAQKELRRPPIHIFLSISMYVRCIWLILLDYWTNADQGFDKVGGCTRTYELETQYPTLIGLNIMVCLLIFTMLSLIAMYLSKTTYSAELRISTAKDEKNSVDSNEMLDVQLYNYVYENRSTVWLWARLRCIHRQGFFVTANFWVYVCGLGFWIYAWDVICSEEDSTEIKQIYVFQVAAIAALFILLTVSFLDTMRRMTYLMKSLQMEKLPTVRRFVLLNRIIFTGAFVYLTAFNGTQVWRFFDIESRAGEATNTGIGDSTGDSDGFSSCHLLYPHVFYTVPEIFLCVTVLYAIRPLRRLHFCVSTHLESNDRQSETTLKSPESVKMVQRSRGRTRESLEHMAERRALLRQKFQSSSRRRIKDIPL